MVEGPLAWRNWRAYTSAPEVGLDNQAEVLLCSDAHVVGEAVDGLGPYQLFNALPADREGAAPALVVRASYSFEKPNFTGGADDTDESRYHGGDLFDELAALVSLGLGIRCRSAGLTRMFGEADALGRPAYFDLAIPYLPAGRRSVIPGLRRQVDVSEVVPLLQRYAAITAGDAVALVRVARLYQQAVWAADADPSQAWVQLVSALETAAGQWKPKRFDARARVRLVWPELAIVLDEIDDEYADAIARLVAPVVKSQLGFRQFMEAFSPPPPEVRPVTWTQVDWNDLGQHLDTIYRYRSRALHAGIPFPTPMCGAADTLEDGIPIERPLGVSSWGLDGRWHGGDTPMLLATFEYIARAALVRWWSQLPSSPAAPVPTTTSADIS